jgi:hypothetical protein
MTCCAKKLSNTIAAALFTVWALSATAQTVPSSIQNPNTTDQRQSEKETRITPQQAKELFKSVSTILTFVSDDTKLPIRHDVKRRLITRAQVEKYLQDSLQKDKEAKRMQRDEIMLKKFGFLDRNFHLLPFLVSLLTEQIAAYYDNKTKTVNLLDSVSPAEQKPVIAHELTHALQDQYVNLDKWARDTSNSTSKNVAEDNQRLAIDERGTARDAVLEGQGMAVYLDYTLNPSGKSLRTLSDVGDYIETSADSPVMARAPKFVQESLLFPYRYGLPFEQTLLKDKGQEYAFRGVLGRPPSSSHEIMNPRAYEHSQSIPLLRLPDVHVLLDADYEPYDIGVMSELDVKILAELSGGDAEAAALAPQWNGGLYYVVQNKSAKTAEEKESTASICLLYLSAWRTEGAAAEFMKLYGRELTVKYPKVERDLRSDYPANEEVYQTSEGPVLIARNGKEVFVSESFDLDLARKLQFLVVGAQQGDARRMVAQQQTPVHDPIDDPIHFMARRGVMKAALLH